MNADQTIELIHSWLKDLGYSPEQITQIDTDANSQKIADIIISNQNIVNNKVKTVKIPTIIFNGHRHDGLISVQDLR
jgi:acetylornithine deacetylase/succinyl-diaminopimelate desuccinylase-like protein